MLGQALRIAVGYDDSGVTLQRNAGTQFADLACTDGVLIGDRRGVRIPLRTFTPNAPSGASTLLIHPQGINALFRQSGSDFTLKAESMRTRLSGIPSVPA